MWGFVIGAYKNDGFGGQCYPFGPNRPHEHKDATLWFYKAQYRRPAAKNSVVKTGDCRGLVLPMPSRHRPSLLEK